jgi:hypothetical protein
MWSRKPNLRGLIGAFMALVFAVAVMPGSMAMPAPQSATHHSMDCMAGMSMHCDHAKPVKEQGSPCKNMQVCMGMLGCFGLAAVVLDNALPPVVASDVRVPDLQRTSAGLTLPPNDRPPIV